MMGLFSKQSQTRSEAAKTKGMGKKRCCRFSVSIQNDTDKKLSQLAISCNMTKSQLVDTILLSTLNSPSYVEQIQERYNKDEKYYIRPFVVQVNGKQDVIYD